VGDFMQLPAVAKRLETLYRAAIQYLCSTVEMTAAETEGANLFTKFRKSTLTEQVRSIDDRHTAMIEKLADPTVECPVTDDIIDQWEELDAQDLENDLAWLVRV